MPSEWRRRRTSELLAEGVLAIGDGYRAKNDELGSEGLPFARAGNIDGGFQFEGADRFPKENLSRVGEKVSRPGDVVFTSKGTVGRFAFVRETTPSFVYSPQLCYWRSLRPDMLDPRFLYYWMCGPDFWAQAAGVKGQTDMAEYVSLSDQRRMYLSFPSFPTQHSIARILGALDDKIELNRKMNETLEQMARAIFKSWFVDFEPFRDKGMVDSPLGRIPKGWRAGSVYEVADVIYGAPFASSAFNTDGVGKLLIRIRDLPNESPEVWTPEVHPKGYVVRPGDIVVGMDGEFRAYLWGGAEAWLNQRVCAFVPKAGYSAAFVRNSITEPLAGVEATETATTVIHLGKSDIDRFAVVVPSPEVLEEFNEVCQPLYDRIVAGKGESRTLAAIRDALLPKLMSGAVLVPSSAD
jgi:type I restriction enzyme S subunit